MLADSIDALAVGVSFAFLKVDILPAALMIGLTTFGFSVAGVKIGNQFGARCKAKAEAAGGIILLLMGISILLGVFADARKGVLIWQIPILPNGPWPTL